MDGWDRQSEEAESKSIEDKMLHTEKEDGRQRRN